MDGGQSGDFDRAVLAMSATPARKKRMYVRGWYRRTAGVVEHSQPATWSEDIAVADDVVLS